MLRRYFLTLAAATALAAPALAVPLGDDGLHKPDWLRDTFLDLAEDQAEAADEGRTLLLLVEQRGCVYCDQMHKTVFTEPDIEEALTEQFFVVQLNMFGDREVTDFDGTTLPEKDMVRRWGLLFTPTMMFLPDPPEEAGATAAQAAAATMPGAFGAHTTRNLLSFIADEVYRTDEPFQTYHARRLAETGIVE